MILPNPIRVLSVDDSPFFRRVLTDILGRRTDIELVGCANDPYEARGQLQVTPVDVLTLDLEMPRMTGMTFLKLIMERRPLPVIILSSLTPTGSQQAVEALIAGAFDVIPKPETISARNSFAEKLVARIKSAAAAPLRRPRPRRTVNSIFAPQRSTPGPDPRQIIALGASTGGTEALQEILTKLPAQSPGIAIVQHIPAGFSASFAMRLNKLCAMEVREAKDGDVMRAGLALLAPGDRHMELRWARDHYRVRLHSGPAVEHQRPSVDILFRSLATCAGNHAIAALLTGMGHDGAAGMKELHDHGAYTLAQNEETSVVYGMAKQAVELNAVDAVLPLETIAGEITKAVEQYHSRQMVMH